MNPQVVEIVKELPPQIDPSLGEKLVEVGRAVDGGSKALFFGNFVVNIFLSGAIQQMLSALKKLHIMVHLLLVNV